MFSKHTLFRFGIGLGYAFLGIIVLYFLFRGIVLDKIIHKFEQSLSKEYEIDLSIEQSSFNGISTISLKGIRLSQEGKRVLFLADSVRVEHSISALITGEIKIKSIYLLNSKLSLICDSTICNYSSLLKPKKVNQTKKTDSETNYASVLNKILRKVFNLAPQQANIEKFQLEFKNDSIYENIFIPSYRATEKLLEGIVQDLSSGYQWKWTGSFSQRDETFDVSFFPLSSKAQNLPILRSFFSIDCSMDTLHLALYNIHYGNGKLNNDGHFSTENLRVFNTRISQDTVRIAHLTFDSKISVEDKSIALDSASMIELNSLKIRPFIKIENSASKKFDIQLSISPTEATDFFYSLPEGVFEVVRDIVGDGLLVYSLDFHLDSSQSDSLIFSSILNNSRFHLTRFGESNLLKINGPFRHLVYENDRLFRTIEVGPENPNFTPIDSISPLFQSAVLTSEDGNFYSHAGFNEEAFRKSIAANYKAGRFQRGGSTISMQLVKNVYLTRKKTIARKAEEALIVWLLESNRLVSKKRMFEVYLNIIELGPGVYGIAEASQFYFSKKPMELDLAESIFLANLLPRPKWYRSNFDEQGQLKPYLEDYYRVVSNFMLKKELITQEQYDQLKPQVNLVGPARELVVKTDSVNNVPQEIEE